MPILTRLRELMYLSKNITYRKIPSDLSDHLYRDIGLSRDEVERLRMELPSQSSSAPNL
ncbi:uncharacterized protein DUF1127 [Litoreibacter meonggei]|uniref:Uncharacterized protein DUF1127 n=1 Tax=Litoreibacter meonggei TaxID=1049199 RepID=A0A497X6D6_9RHOB|nr:uncharacterized protein DUF1127 [Litoreibacter meonggei]